MSFTGIFKARDGIVAIADSKASIKEHGHYIEDVGRNPQKLFPFANGIAVTFGANQILVQNPNELFSKTIAIETIVCEYLHQKNTLDASFFQTFLVKMTSNPSNQEPVNFLIGRKIRSGEYLLEHHQIRANRYAQRLASSSDHYFTGGSELYKQAFNQIDYLNQITSAEILQKFIASKLDTLIRFYDQTLSYNPVGHPVKSYILR